MHRNDTGTMMTFRIDSVIKIGNLRNVVMKKTFGNFYPPYLLSSEEPISALHSVYAKKNMHGKERRECSLLSLLFAWLHNVTHYPDPPDAEYPVYLRDFVNREAYLRFLEQVEEPHAALPVAS